MFSSGKGNDLCARAQGQNVYNADKCAVNSTTVAYFCSWRNASASDDEEGGEDEEEDEEDEGSGAAGGRLVLK